MALSPQFTTVLAGALAVLVGASIAFGHRYADKRSKLDENSSELNEISIGIRTETTVPSLDKLYRYLVETEKTVGSSNFDVASLFYDVNRRKQFNHLINELERTFSDSSNVKNTWLTLRASYGRLGDAFYGFAVVVGAGGYTLLLLESDYLGPLTPALVMPLFVLFVAVAIVIGVLITVIHRRITTNLRTYEKAKDRQLIVTRL